MELEILRNVYQTLLVFHWLYSELPNKLLMIIAKLTESGWLHREFDVFTPKGFFKVVYAGRGLGYERIWVNSQMVCHKDSPWWSAPEFSFPLGEYSAHIKVRISIWMTISFLSLEANGEQVYIEGKE